MNLQLSYMAANKSGNEHLRSTAFFTKIVFTYHLFEGA